MNRETITRLTYWIKERYRIFTLREDGKDWPWTTDRILQQYRFCNVHRENDKVTRWIAKNWREPYRHEADLWFAMLVARLVNWPPTLEELGFGFPGYGWRRSYFTKVLKSRRDRDDKVWTGVYIVSTNGNKMDKIDYIASVLDSAWKMRKRIRPVEDGTLQGFAAQLMEIEGVGGFIAGQVIADLKYVQMENALDWWTFAISGPGSRRGLNRVCGRDKNSPWHETDWRMRLQGLQTAIDPKLARAGIPRLHAQDLQNCLCEFDKYERARLGEGKPRNNYRRPRC